MRLLYLIHKPQNRGAETFTCQLCTALSEMGHSVKIVSIFKGEADLPWSGSIESLEGNPHKRFLDIKAWQKLSYIIASFQPELIQCNAGDTLKYAVFSKKIFGWKQPIIARNASEVGRYLNSSLQKKMNAYLYRNVAKVISVSKASEKDIVSHFPFLQGQIEMIPVGLEDKPDITPILLPNAKTKHIVHVGGFSFEKNHKGLLRIFKRILEQDASVTLELVGDGPLRSDIEEMTEEYGLKDKVNFHGFVNNPLSYIKAADVLVLPSIIEGLPGVLLEAMYCKTPVVACDVGGISEIVSEQTGSLIKKGDEDSFAEATLEALRSPDKIQIEAAYEMVTMEFMNAGIALKFVNSYEKLVE